MLTISGFSGIHKAHSEKGWVFFNKKFLKNKHKIYCKYIF